MECFHLCVILSVWVLSQSHDNKKAKYDKTVIIKHSQNWNTKYRDSLVSIETRQQDVRPQNGDPFSTNARE